MNAPKRFVMPRSSSARSALEPAEPEAAGRVVRHSYLSLIGTVGILTLPAFILTSSALILAFIAAGTALLMPWMPAPFSLTPSSEVLAAAELAVHDLADDVDDRDVDALDGRGEQLLAADLLGLVGVDADGPVALVARRVDGTEAALAGDLEDDVRALSDLLLREALALVLGDEVTGVAVEQLDAGIRGLGAGLEAGDVVVDRRDGDAADGRDDVRGVEALGLGLLEEAREVADEVARPPTPCRAGPRRS